MGGTWLGLNKKQKLGILTNYRDPLLIDMNYKSRGMLILDYLNLVFFYNNVLIISFISLSLYGL